MTFRDLEVFIAICKEGSMSKAAAFLYITQPSVSQSINQLESEFQVKLFNRLSHKIYITEEGEVFLNYAKKIVLLKEETQKAMEAMTGSAVLKIGGTVTIGTYCLPWFLKKAKQEMPGLKIQSFIYNTAAIVKALNESKLDMALIEGKITDASINTIPYYQDELILVCDETHPLLKKRSLKATDLEGYDFILREEGSGSRLLFEEMMNKQNLSYITGHVFNNNTAIENAAQSGAGIGVISKLSLSDSKRTRVLKVSDFKMYRDFVIAFHKDKYVNEAMQKSMEMIKTLEITSYARENSMKA